MLLRNGKQWESKTPFLVCTRNGNSRVPLFPWEQCDENGNGHDVVLEREWEKELLLGNGRQWEPKTLPSDLYRVLFVVWSTDRASNCAVNCVLETIILCVWSWCCGVCRFLIPIRHSLPFPCSNSSSHSRSQRYSFSLPFFQIKFPLPPTKIPASRNS